MTPAKPVSVSRQRQGEAAILVGTLVGSFFPVLALLSYNTISPLMSLAVSSLVAAIFFAVILTVRNRWHELRKTGAMLHTLTATCFIALFYVFFYLGIRDTGPGNVSILALTEVFFSFLFFHVLRKEHIPRRHIIGAILIVSGAIIALYPTFSGFHPSNLYVIFGTAIVPIGNLYAQRARKQISTEALMFVRVCFTAILIWLLARALGVTGTVGGVVAALPYLFINGILIFGFTTFLWVEGIHRISVTKAKALNSISPLLTLFIVWALLKTPPTQWQLMAFIPMFLGVILLGAHTKGKQNPI